jgi:hypothetical protein
MATHDEDKVTFRADEQAPQGVPVASAKSSAVTASSMATLS